MIKFRKVSQYGHKKPYSEWQYAKDEKQLEHKLGKGCFAEVYVEDENPIKKLLRKLYPLMGLGKTGIEYHVTGKKVVAIT